MPEITETDKQQKWTGKSGDFVLKSLLFWKIFAEPFLALISLIFLTQAGTQTVALQQAGITPLYTTMNIVLVMAQIPCAIALWKRKRWGTYGLFICGFIQWFLATSKGGTSFNPTNKRRQKLRGTQCNDQSSF